MMRVPHLCGWIIRCRMHTECLPGCRSTIWILAEVLSAACGLRRAGPIITFGISPPLQESRHLSVRAVSTSFDSSLLAENTTQHRPIYGDRKSRSTDSLVWDAITF